MKKTIAILLAASTLFLCSCSDNKKDTETTTVEQITSSTDVSVTTKNSTVKYINEWGTDLLPADFPAPPAKTHDIEIQQFEADESYISGCVSIQFTCPENEIYKFTNDLLKAGYIGGAKSIEGPTKYYRAGFNGSWQNGKNIIRVAASRSEENDELTLVIDITECKDNFPLVLTNFFPKFNGFSKNDGLYSEYDEEKNRLDNQFTGSLNAKSWSWDFGHERTFIGVSEAELEAYVDELVKAEFGGSCATSTTDGCTVISYDLIKKVDNMYYGVFIAYNQILKTMDILYTNDATLLVEI